MFKDSGSLTPVDPICVVVQETPILVEGKNGRVGWGREEIDTVGTTGCDVRS